MNEVEQEKQAIEKWGNFFLILGVIFIFASIFDLLIGFGTERFTIEAGEYYSYNEFSAAVLWTYVTSTTIPAIVSGIAFLFTASVIELASNFYKKICDIESTLKK